MSTEVLKSELDSELNLNNPFSLENANKRKISDKSKSTLDDEITTSEDDEDMRNGRTGRPDSRSSSIPTSESDDSRSRSRNDVDPDKSLDSDKKTDRGSGNSDKLSKENKSSSIKREHSYASTNPNNISARNNRSPSPIRFSSKHKGVGGSRFKRFKEFDRRIGRASPDGREKIIELSQANEKDKKRSINVAVNMKNYLASTAPTTARTGQKRALQTSGGSVNGENVNEVSVVELRLKSQKSNQIFEVEALKAAIEREEKKMEDLNEEKELDANLDNLTEIKGLRLFLEEMIRKIPKSSLRPFG